MKHIRRTLLALCAVTSVMVVGSLQGSSPAQAGFSDRWDKFFEDNPNLGVLKDAVSNVAGEAVPGSSAAQVLIQLSSELKTELKWAIRAKRLEAMEKAAKTGDWETDARLEAMEACLNGNCDEWLRVQKGERLTGRVYPPQPPEVTPPTPGPVAKLPTPLPPMPVGPGAPPPPSVPPVSGPPATPTTPGPVGPPPSTGPTVTGPSGPVTVTPVRRKGGGLICYYKDGTQRWDVTIYDKDVTECPRVYGRPASGSAPSGPPPVMLQDPKQPAIPGLGVITVMPGDNSRPPAPLPPVALNTPPNVTPPGVTPPATLPPQTTTPAAQSCPPGQVFSRCWTTNLSSGTDLIGACRNPDDFKRQAEQYLKWERDAGRCTMGGAPFVPKTASTGLKSAVLPVEPLPPPSISHTPAPLPPLVLPPPQIASIPHAPDHVQPEPKKPKKKAKPQPQPKKYVNRHDPQAAARDAAIANALIGIAIGVASSSIRSGNRGGGGGGHRPMPSGGGHRGHHR